MYSMAGWYIVFVYDFAGLFTLVLEHLGLGLESGLGFQGVI